MRNLKKILTLKYGTICHFEKRGRVKPNYGLSGNFPPNTDIESEKMKMYHKVKTTSLDRLATKAVRLREKNICQRCKKYAEGRNSHCAHIIGRRCKSTRWYLRNLLHLCFKCHSYFHSEVTEFNEWVKGLMGENEYNKLQLMSCETWDKDSFKWKIYLEDYIKNAENTNK